jgi:hypothetical protein
LSSLRPLPIRKSEAAKEECGLKGDRSTVGRSQGRRYVAAPQFDLSLSSLAIVDTGIITGFAGGELFSGIPDAIAANSEVMATQEGIIDMT